jgi:hypothetical protein
MRSPALAMGWELWGKNRVAILAAFGAVLVGFILALALPTSSRDELILPLSAVLLMILFLQLVAIFTHPEFRFRNAYAGFPARKFTLPVGTRALVAWHMLYGIAGLVILWIAMCLLIWLPAGIEPAWGLLALLAVSLVWMQAICWAIPRPPFLQIVAVCVIFPALKFCLELTAYYMSSFHDQLFNAFPNAPVGAGPLTLLVFSTGAILAGYVFAVVGVARVRHGKGLGLSWNYFYQASVDSVPRWRGSFSSPARAQFWYEVRRRGVLFLPLFALAYLTFMTLVMSPFARAESMLDALFLMTGPFLATAFCIGYGMGKPSFWGELGFTSWDATRPVSSGVIALAKLQAGVASAFATCILLFLLVPGWIWLVLGADFTRSHILNRLTVLQIGEYGPVLFLAIAAITWGQMAGALCLSLTKRAWIVNIATMFSVFMLSVFLVSWSFYSKRPESVPSFWAFWTSFAALMVATKLILACFFLFSGLRRRLISWPEITPILVLWCLGAASVIMTIHQFAPLLHRSAVIRHLALPPMPDLLSVLAAILLLPLVRITAAPAAVAWSRHG